MLDQEHVSGRLFLFDHAAQRDVAGVGEDLGPIEVTHLDVFVLLQSDPAHQAIDAVRRQTDQPAHHAVVRPVVDHVDGVVVIAPPPSDPTFVPGLQASVGVHPDAHGQPGRRCDLVLTRNELAWLGELDVARVVRWVGTASVGDRPWFADLLAWHGGLPPCSAPYPARPAPAGPPRALGAWG